MISFFNIKIQKRPASGRFRKFVEFDQSKGIGGLARPRRSRFGYWFGRLTTTGGEISTRTEIKFWRAHCKLIETPKKTLKTHSGDEIEPLVQLTAYPRVTVAWHSDVCPFDDVGGWECRAWSSKLV